MNKSTTLQMTIDRIDDKSKPITKDIDCLQTVTLNISETCQLKCSFCPRSKGYHHPISFMNEEIATYIRNNLSYIDYHNTLSISGMGEPFLHPHINSIINILTDNGNAKYKTQILTNGLAKYDYDKILNYGVKIIVSIHDDTKDTHLPIMDYKSDNIIYRDHTSSSKEMIPTNRAGYIKDGCNKNTCYYPFYKIFIDYDGSYLLCQEDWKRVTKVKKYKFKDKYKSINIKQMDIEKYFTSYLFPYKQQFCSQDGYIDRKNILSHNLCGNCNAIGIVMGERYYEYFRSKYDDYSRSN